MSTCSYDHFVCLLDHFVCLLDHSGILACLDGYMNIAMEQTEEYVNGQLKNKYGDAFIRGNNGIYVCNPLIKKPQTNKQTMLSFCKHLLSIYYLIHAVLYISTTKKSSPEVSGNST